MKRARRTTSALAALAAASATPGMSQEPEPQMIEREIVIGEAPLALPGLLTLPAGRKGPFPLVVLVHGSGPNDRDETIGPNRPFRDLARGLAERGVAVLRYDKRTRVYPMSFANRVFTVREETIDDALAAIRLARTLPEVDSLRVVVAGHSLGGILAPRIAEMDGRLAGVVLLAGASDESLPDMIDRQFAYLLTLPGADTTVIAAQQRAMAPGLASVRALTPADSASVAPLLGAPAAYWLDLAAYNSLATAKRLRMPLLIVQGARDYQTGDRAFARWQSELAARSDVTFRLYPALNHLFMPGTGPGNPAEYAVPGRVAEVVLEDLATWIAGLAPR
ncbi:MAG: alpha/beta hydrolase family protein [Gemmatimonadota bacterium]